VKVKSTRTAEHRLKEDLQLHLQLNTAKFRSVIHQEKENVNLTTYESGQIFLIKTLA